MCEASAQGAMPDARARGARLSREAARRTAGGFTGEPAISRPCDVRPPLVRSAGTDLLTDLDVLLGEGACVRAAGP